MDLYNTVGMEGRNGNVDQTPSNRKLVIVSFLEGFYLFIKFFFFFRLLFVLDIRITSLQYHKPVNKHMPSSIS